MRQLVSSGSPFEPVIGLSRAVRIGPWISVSGTAPLGPDGKTVHAGDVYAQTKRCLEIVAKAIVDAGGTLDHVVRTRVILTRMDAWRDAARAHGEVFHAIRPANTFFEVTRFIDPDWLVEIEADAYVG
ncbi:MAG: RidA family protein [Acidobacteriota bacterium]